MGLIKVSARNLNCSRHLFEPTCSCGDTASHRLQDPVLGKQSAHATSGKQGPGRMTIGEVIKLTGASRNTLKQHFRALVERGAIEQHGSGRGVWYDLI